MSAPTNGPSCRSTSGSLPTSIDVHPDWWNQGIGTALLERGLELLPGSIDTVRLEMVAGNEIGQRLYALQV